VWVGQEEIKIGQGIIGSRYLGEEGAIIDNIKAGKKCFEVILACNNIETTLVYIENLVFGFKFFFRQKMFFLLLAVVLVLSHRVVVVVWFNHGNSMITAAGFVFFNKFFVKRFINSGICRHVKNLDQDEVCLLVIGID